jgi:hypothetical protein
MGQAQLANLSAKRKRGDARAPGRSSQDIAVPGWWAIKENIAHWILQWANNKKELVAYVAVSTSTKLPKCFVPSSQFGIFSPTDQLRGENCSSSLCLIEAWSHNRVTRFTSSWMAGLFSLDELLEWREYIVQKWTTRKYLLANLRSAKKIIILQRWT